MADEATIALECAWLHVDPSIPATQWHYKDGFKDFVIGDGRGSNFETVPIHVQTFCKTITLDVRLSDTVDDVRKWIHAMEAIPLRDQHLALGGQPLSSNTSRLSDNGIGKDSTLLLTDKRPVTWSCVKTTASDHKRGSTTTAALFFQCHGSTLDVFCIEKDELPVDRLSLEFAENEEVREAAVVVAVVAIGRRRGRVQRHRARLLPVLCMLPMPCLAGSRGSERDYVASKKLS
jgi:hypothetical protein